MGVRERRHQEQRVQPAAPALPAPAAAGEAVWDAAERLLSVGEEAIQRALSQDSERFLTENRQQGGQ
jgi:hypothetical protein